MAACSAPPPEELPAELLTVWRTQAPGYEDRAFELRDGWVVFGTGRYSNDIHQIQSVHSESVPGGIRYTIEYRAEDGETVPLEIFYSAGPPIRLRVGQQRDTWFPEERDSEETKETSG